ncbi:hypothetical protein BGZ54_000105 [Gamsiella multidivaricata]|nr:hypothetical protein BGZ54_000105 [Gamsiella multidivaricata]
MHRTLLSRLNSPPVLSFLPYFPKTRALGIATIPLFLFRTSDLRLNRIACRYSLVDRSLITGHHGRECRNGYSTFVAARRIKANAAVIESNPVAARTQSRTLKSLSTEHTLRNTASSTSSSTSTTPVLPAPSHPTSSIARSTSSSSLVSKPSTKALHNWDEQLDALILSLHLHHGVHWRTIGELIGRPYTTCYSRYLRILNPALSRGWKPPPIEDQIRLQYLVDQARLITQSKQEASIAAKAAAATTKGQVKEALATESTVMTRKRAVWDLETDRKIKEMVLAGTPWPEIGLALNRPYASCYSRYYSALEPTLHEPWSPETVARVNELVGQGVSWKTIAKELDMLPTACKAKWRSMRRFDSAIASWEMEPGTDDETASSGTATKSKVKWIAFSKEESLAILELVEKHGQENWDQILKDFHERFLDTTASSSNPSSVKRNELLTQRILNITVAHLRHQYSCVANSKLHWTFDQETMLIQQVLRHGIEGHWEETARLVGLRTPAECRSHWKQLDMPIHVHPTKWTKTEQSAFWILWKHFGSDFERLSRLGGGHRSPEDCQQYFQETTQGFPDPEIDPEAFDRQIEELQATFPPSDLKYYFTKERSLRLQRALKYYTKQTGQSVPVAAGWEWIASKVQSGLAALVCKDHWNYLRKNMDVVSGPVEQKKTAVEPVPINSWSHEELKLLDQGIRTQGLVWSDIQKRFLPWRTARAIRQRWLLTSDRPIKVTEQEYYTILAAGEKSTEIDYDARMEPVALSTNL